MKAKVKTANYILIVAIVLILTAYIPGMLLAQAAQTQSASPIGNTAPDKSETAVGSLVADSIKAYARSDAAFVSASELRTKDEPFPAGKLAASDIAGLLTYPDEPISIIEITGKQIDEALEKAVSIYPQPNLAFLQVSGIVFTFDPAKKTGDRITAISINNVPYIETRQYTVAVTNSMANGALGYWKVWTDSNIKTKLNASSVSKALDSYFAKTPKIDYSNLNRINIVGK